MRQALTLAAALLLIAPGAAAASASIVSPTGSVELGQSFTAAVNCTGFHDRSTLGGSQPINFTSSAPAWTGLDADRVDARYNASHGTNYSLFEYDVSAEN